MTEQVVHLLVGVYRTTFDLLRAGAFTNVAMHDEIKRSFAGGYHQGEVDDCLAVLVSSGDLRVREADADHFFVAGPNHPAPALLAPR